MNIKKYTSFFHDGSVLDIQHVNDKMILSMESAEMDKDDIKDDITLSKDDRIRGKLHIEKIKRIKLNKKLFLGTIKKTYDDGGIFDFEIKKNSVELSIDWVNFPPKTEVNDFSVIKIEAEKIWWENIPDLEDSIR
jgi:hypothetical protein